MGAAFKSVWKRSKGFEDSLALLESTQTEREDDKLHEMQEEQKRKRPVEQDAFPGSEEMAREDSVEQEELAEFELDWCRLVSHGWEDPE